MAGRGRDMVMPAWATRGTPPVPASPGYDRAAPAAAPAVAPAAAPAAEPAPQPHEQRVQVKMEQQPQPHEQRVQQQVLLQVKSEQHLWQQQQQMQQQQQQQQQLQQMQQRKVAPDGWAENTAEDGRVYYYNQFTGATTYDKPRSLMSEVERKLPTTVWKEYSREGKAYFFNSATQESVWEEPLDFTRYKERVRALCSGDAPTKDMQSLALYNAARAVLEQLGEGSAASAASAGKEVRSAKVRRGAELDLTEVSGELRAPAGQGYAGLQPEEEQAPGAHELAREAFMEMLKERRVPAGASWADAMTYGIANDARFYALRGAAARVAALEGYAEYARSRQRGDLEAELGALAAAGKLTARSRLREVLDLLGGSAARAALEAISTRSVDDCIDDFLDELYKRAKAEARERRAKETAALEAVLAQWLAQGRLPCEQGDLRWSAALGAELLAAAPARELQPADLEPIVLDFVARERRRREEVAQAETKAFKDQFRAPLLKFAAWLDAELRTSRNAVPGSFKSFWSKSAANLAKLREQPWFTELALALASTAGQQDSSGDNAAAGAAAGAGAADAPGGGPSGQDRALALLDEEGNVAIDALLDRSDECKKLLRAALKDCRVEIRTELDDPQDAALIGSVDQLLDKLEPAAREKLHAGFVESVRNHAFKKLSADAGKKLLRRMEAFEDMLTDVLCKPQFVGLPWTEAQHKVSKEQEYEDLPSPFLREHVFNTYMAKLAQRQARKGSANSPVNNSSSSKAEDKPARKRASKDHDADHDMDEDDQDRAKRGKTNAPQPQQQQQSNGGAQRNAQENAQPPNPDAAAMQT
jgi:hypothetical protein